MIIKKYIVNDMKEAMTRAKYELGLEASIVSNRIIRVRKWYNLIGKRMVEATFAVDEDKREKKSEIFMGSVQPTEEPADMNAPTTEDPIFAHGGAATLQRLESYRKLHNKVGSPLNAWERKEFFNILLRGSSFDTPVDNSRIKILVGPTGVGKTTTVAKIAADQSLGYGKKVGILTIDTYRIGAVEQLKTYAGILNLPFHVVRGPEQMGEKLELLKDCDLILVDTLGTSPKDMKKQVEIKKSLNAITGDTSTYLVVSLSADREVLRSTMERYRILNYDRMVLTKFDELESPRNFWYLLENNTIPIQYFCHGQEVPDDIKEATSENLFNYMEENFNHDRPSWEIKNYG